MFDACHVAMSCHLDCVSEEHDDVKNVFIGEEKEYKKISGFFCSFFLFFWPHFKEEIIMSSW